VYDVFEREPYIASFVSGNFDFTIIGSHIKPNDAYSEMGNLTNVVNFVLSDNPDEQDTIVMGDFNADGTPDADVEIRCIEETGTPISDLRDAANDLPLQKHIAPPPPGSGYSMKYFQVRRYGVTATSATGNTQIQTGVWKVFNKSQ